MFKILSFYLDRNQSHGQNDSFLRFFLLKLNVCRPKEDLRFWKFNYYSKKSTIILFHELKQLKIVIQDKTDSVNSQLIEVQKKSVNKIIKIYKQSSNIREQLTFIDLTNDLDSDNVLAYQFIENKKVIEFLQWRATIEIKDWMESCENFLEPKNWFSIDFNNYLRELKH